MFPQQNHGHKTKLKQIIQNLNMYNSSVNLQNSASSKQRLNIHKELIKYEIEQQKERCIQNKILSQQQNSQEIQRNDHQNKKEIRMNKKNEDLLNVLQLNSLSQSSQIQDDQINDKNDQTIFKNKDTTQLNNIDQNIFSKNKDIQYKNGVSKNTNSYLPFIKEINLDTQQNNNDINSYYDPMITKDTEQNSNKVKSNMINNQNIWNIKKVSCKSLHDVVNDQLLSIRNSRKNLQQNESFNSLNQNNLSLDQNNLQSICNQNHSFSLKRKVSNEDNMSINNHAYQKKKCEENTSSLLNNLLPKLNHNQQNTVNIPQIQNISQISLSHQKTEPIQNTNSNNLNFNNIYDSYNQLNEHQKQTFPLQIYVSKTYQKRNQSLSEKSNSFDAKQMLLQSQSKEIDNQALYNTPTNSLYTDNSQNIINTKQNLSKDQLINNNHTVNEQILNSKKAINTIKSLKQINEMHKLNIFEILHQKVKNHKIQPKLIKKNLQNNDDSTEDLIQKLLTERIKQKQKLQGSNLNQYSLKKQDVHRIKDKLKFTENNKVNKLVDQNNSSDKKSKNSIDNFYQNIQALYAPQKINMANKAQTLDFINNQYHLCKQSHLSNQNNKKEILLNSSSDEKKHKAKQSFQQLRRSGRIKNSLPKSQQNLFLITENQNNNQDNLFHSTNLAPLLVCTQQDIYKQSYKVKKRKESSEDKQEKQKMENSISPPKDPIDMSIIQQRIIAKQNSKRCEKFGSKQNLSYENYLDSDTDFQINEQQIQEFYQLKNPSNQNISIYQENKGMPEIKEEFSQSSRQIHTHQTHQRITSEYTIIDNNEYNLSNSNQDENINQLDFKQLVIDLMKSISELEAIAIEETDELLESYLYNLFTQKKQIQNSLQLFKTQESLIPSAQSLINIIKILFQQQNFSKQYTYHKNKLEQQIQKCEYRINQFEK